MAYRVILIMAVSLAVLFIPHAASADPVTAVVGATIAGFAAGSSAAAIAFSWGAFAASLAVSAVGALLTPKPKKLSSYDSVKGGGTTQQFRQAVTDREIVYGEIRKSGPIVFIATSESNRYLHMVIVLAAHPIQKIGEVIVGDVSITDDMTDGSGNVTSGRYAGHMRIRKYLGAADQAADPYLVAECPGWSTEHRLNNTAYLYVRLKWSQSKFPSGIPPVSAWVYGKTLYDPRTGATNFSQNLPLMISDYLRDPLTGLAVGSEFIHEESLMESANLADEYVAVTPQVASITAVDQAGNLLTLSGAASLQLGDKVRLSSGSIAGLNAGTDYFVIPYQRMGGTRIQLASSYLNACAGVMIDIGAGSVGTLTKIAEPRYHGGGIFQMSAEPGDNLQEMVTCCAGTLSYAGGSWRIYAGGYRLPSVELSESDLAGPVTITTKVSKRDRFNGIQGIYTAPINDGNTASYPMVRNEMYETLDGQFLKRDLDQAFTQRPGQAMRVAKILLECGRQEIIVSASFKLTAFKLQVGDTFFFSFPRYGWDQKIFEVKNWKISTDNAQPVIEMIFRETAAACYDWAAGEETVIDPAPNTALGSVFDVDYPTDIAISVGEVATEQGDKTYQFNVSWTPPDDGFVTEGGRYEVQFKNSSGEVYRPSYFVDGASTQTQINQVEPGVTYDIRLRSVNALGVSSAWTYYVGFTVTSPSGATFAVDYRYFSENFGDVFDYGTFTESPTSTVDFGTYS